MADNIYGQTRARIEEIVGRDIPKREWGIALGLGAADAARVVRSWEMESAKPPRGLAALGLDYLRQGLDDTLPEFTGGHDGTDSYVHRWRWPRFVARVVKPGVDATEEAMSTRLGDQGHRLTLVRWIDTPMFGVDPQALLDAAAAWTEATVPRYRRQPSEPQPEEQAA